MSRHSLDTIPKVQDGGLLVFEDGNFQRFQRPTTKIQVGAAPNDNYFWNAGYMGFHIR